MVFHLISVESKQFDLITAGGNSGVVATTITKMVYQKAGILLPPIAVLPIIRPSINADIAIDASAIGTQLKDVTDVIRILFVDDEIMRGQTARICFESVSNFLKNKNGQTPQLSCTIVGENHFFVWRHDLENIAIRFLPFAMVLQGYNGNFGFLIPDDLLADMSQALQKQSPDRNEALAILLNDTRKVIAGDTVVFQQDMQQRMIETIEAYPQKRQSFIEKIEALVAAGIKEYTNKDIEFKYLNSD